MNWGWFENFESFVMLMGIVVFVFVEIVVWIVFFEIVYEVILLCFGDD